VIKEKKKVLKIVDAFNAYCFYIGGTDVTSKLKKENGIWKFYFKSDFNPKYLSSVQGLEKQINELECGNTEEMYWTILTSEDFKDENDIYLIATMVEKATLNIKNNVFEIKFSRVIKE
jgi:hypothetical protein